MPPLLLQRLGRYGGRGLQPGRRVPLHPHALSLCSRRFLTLQSNEPNAKADLSPAELTRLIEEHAKHPPRPLTLGTLLSFARPPTPESVLASVNYVFAEIPRRLAMRAHSLEALPFIVGMNPFIARTLDAHRRSFQFLTLHPPVRTLEDNAAFAARLEAFVQSHAHDIPTLAKG